MDSVQPEEEDGVDCRADDVNDPEIMDEWRTVEKSDDGVANEGLPRGECDGVSASLPGLARKGVVERDASSDRGIVGMLLHGTWAPTSRAAFRRCETVGVLPKMEADLRAEVLCAAWAGLCVRKPVALRWPERESGVCSNSCRI